MGLSLTHKILRDHLVSGKLEAGSEIGIKVDQTLTQDATGTMAYLQFEAMGLPRVRTELSVSYVDHNMLQTGFENADDHVYLRTVAAKYGILFSKPGNGICHQVHLERFAAPGKTLLGSDSHTPTSGGMGSLAIGAGGLDVAVAMGGGPFYLECPKVLGVELKGSLQPWVASKDVILEMLRRLTVKGGVGRIIEYYGEGVKSLSVPDRGTIANMGAELGATTSIFPSDEQSKRYLKAQGRESVYRPMRGDRSAKYDENMTIDLDTLGPLVACPSSPDNIKPVEEVAGTVLGQVCVGSCTNSSIMDLNTVAEVLEDKKVAPGMDLTLTPGSRQVFEMIAKNGALAELISSGARVLESACGPCIGMGQAPPSGAASLRTFNRNFEGRSGTPADRVYLCSPEVAAASALKGTITDPRTLGTPPSKKLPSKFLVDDGLILHPSADPAAVTVVRGPNIKPVPVAPVPPDTIEGQVLLKMGDNISTDHILPAGAKVLPLRSNIPAISEFTLARVDPTFPQRARAAGGGLLLGGDNYGQGSSREHAAIVMMYLGVRAVVAKSFARIHFANLINFGVLPVTLESPLDFDKVEQGDPLKIAAVRSGIAGGALTANHGKAGPIGLKVSLTERQREIYLAGGLLNHTKKSADRAERTDRASQIA
jgi:aconitate hydratase